MAFPTYQAAGAFVEAVAGGVSPAWPTHQTGDIGLLIVVSEEHCTLSVPAGFKPIGRVHAWDNVTFHTTLSVFWCRATSNAMASPTVEHTGTEVRACIITVRGCGASGQPYSAYKVGRNEAGTGAITIPALTTPNADSLILGIIGFKIDAIGTTAVSAYTNANLANIVEQIDSCSNIGAGAGLAVFTAEKAVAGDIGATTATGASSSVWPVMHIAFDTVDTRELDKYPYLHGWGVRANLAAAGSITPAWPSHQANDIGVLIVESGGWPVPAPAGWTEFPNSPQTAGSSGTTAGTSLSVFWKRAASAAEAAPSLAFIGDHICGRIITFRDVPTGGNPYDVTAGNNNNPTSSTNISCPGITTTKPWVLVVAIASNSTNNSNRDLCTSEANVDLTDFQELLEDNLGGVGAGSGWNIYTGKRRNAGVVGATTATLTTSSLQGRVTIGLVGQQGIDIDAEKATFTLTTNPAEVVRSLELSAATGAFAVTPVAADLVIDNSIELLAETANFQVETYAAELQTKFGRWSRKLSTSNEWTKESPEE